MNEQSQIPISSLSDEQLTSNLIQLAVQDVAIQQTKVMFVTELMRRQQQKQQQTPSESIILPKLKKIQLPTTQSASNAFSLPYEEAQFHTT